MQTDTQVIELMGRHWLISQLLSFGLEVAVPVRDRGVDLIVYKERGKPFWSLPVQVKTASFQSFSIDRKYDKAPGLLIAYVWDVRPEATPSAYVLTRNEALASPGMQVSQTLNHGSAAAIQRPSPARSCFRTFKALSPTRTDGEAWWRGRARAARTLPVRCSPRGRVASCLDEMAGQVLVGGHRFFANAVRARAKNKPHAEQDHGGHMTSPDATIALTSAEAEGMRPLSR